MYQLEQHFVGDIDQMYPTASAYQMSSRGAQMSSALDVAVVLRESSWLNVEFLKEEI